MSLSASPLKFLFDENVDKRLERFLKQKGVDIISKPKGLANGELAESSRSEERVLVTNDNDFTKLSKDKVFSVVWLKIPQRRIEFSRNAFLRLLKEVSADEFKGNLIAVYEERFEIIPLSSFT